MSTMPASWEVPDFLRTHATMSIVSTRARCLCIRGYVRELRAGCDGAVLDLDYRIEMLFPWGFPHRLPSVRELSGHIAPAYHTMRNGSLCLGSRLRLLGLARAAPTIEGFFEDVVVPYLYGHAHKRAHGDVPSGELEHGARGLLKDYCEMLRFEDPDECRRALVLLGYRRRIANKRPCFCGSGIRLGKCHNRRINGLRHLASCRAFRRVVADLR